MVRTAVDLCVAHHFSGKDYDKTIEVASKVIGLLEATRRESESFGTVNPYCMLLSYWSISVNIRGDFEKGQTLYDRSCVFALSIKDPIALSISQSHQGLALVLYRGDGRNGTKCLQDAIGYLERRELLVLLGHAWMGLGWGHYLLGDLDTARKQMEKGIAMTRDAGLQELVSLHYSYLTAVHLDSGDLEKAQSCAEEALRLSQENQEMSSEGLARVILGRVWGKRNERPLIEAEASILAGVKILEEVEVKPIVAQGQFYLGELYADAGQTKKALASLKKAEAMCQEMGMDYWLQRTRAVLSKLNT
jgi:tetratricopeptide (TPR) repeat protein